MARFRSCVKPAVLRTPWKRIMNIEHTGTGFSFANYNAHEMLGTIRYALSVFYQQKNGLEYGLIQRNETGFFLESFCRKYEDIIRKTYDFE